ncbi:Shikimate kinase, chloroplastic [Morella rubra]|uniref:Shikimate kinase, chloroplastic n=1 Tax=Morella rubra TaxID=262757 RepID=A0A6A1W3U6_9ROSI|nr:Shikimate kinase, chloroplastic [Morella rubra]
MEATCGAASQLSTFLIGSKSIGGKQNVAVVPLNQRGSKDCKRKICCLPRKNLCTRQRRFDLALPHSCCQAQAITILESGNFYASFNEDWLLKNKAKEVGSRLKGRSIFLLEMYSICGASDAYVEQTMGGTSVAQIFEQRGESFFRDEESAVLRKLSLVPRQVVATGGGVVVRPINWKFMRQGITVFLDVPLDALARRIAAVGTDSRPLLHFDSGDPYTKVAINSIKISKPPH